jgi:hypothetical protein
MAAPQSARPATPDTQRSTPRTPMRETPAALFESVAAEHGASRRAAVAARPEEMIAGARERAYILKLTAAQDVPPCPRA